MSGVTLNQATADYSPLERGELPEKRAKATMAHISVPESLVTPMEHIAAGVSGLRIAFVNVFAVTHQDDSWTLIDAGLPFTASLIHNWAEKHLKNPPRAIVLTHGHFDHVSAAGDLADKWKVPIYAHPLEFPYLTGKKEYPPPDVGAGGGLMSLLSPLYPKGPVDLGGRLHPLPLQEEVGSFGELPEWQVLHTPGHTPGHVSFFRRADRVLLVGDAFCTTKPESFFDAAIAQAAELHGPPAYFTSDWNEALRSIRRLAELNPEIIAPGHGRPLSGGEIAEKVSAFAAQFTPPMSGSKARSNL